MTDMLFTYDPLIQMANHCMFQRHRKPKKDASQAPRSREDVDLRVRFIFKMQTRSGQLLATILDFSNHPRVDVPSADIKKQYKAVDERKIAFRY